MVSIIIPAYNAGAFLAETLQSVLVQTCTDWEILVIDDGSTDNTADVASSFADSRLRLIRQPNAGVSRSRNKGLELAGGEYLLFLDADDLLTPEFLAIRVAALDNDPGIGFAGGWVETFPKSSGLRKAVAEDPQNQVLFFDAKAVTIPSNYLFRKEVLLKNNIFFNPELSSTADRFFILQLSAICQGAVVEKDKGNLLYRVSENSMSGKVTPALIRDNEKFYGELKKKSLWPSRKSSFQSLYFLSLAKGFALVGSWGRAAGYLVRSFFAQPVYFAGQVLRGSARKQVTE